MRNLSEATREALYFYIQLLLGICAVIAFWLAMFRVFPISIGVFMIVFIDCMYSCKAWRRKQYWTAAVIFLIGLGFGIIGIWSI